MSKRMLLIISQIILLSGYCFGNSWVQTSDEDFVVGSSSNIVFSGDDSIRLDPIEIVSTKTEVLPTARIGTSSVYDLSNHRIYIFGGNSNGEDLQDIIEYNPGTGNVTIKSEVLPSKRFGTAAVYFPPNNKIYIFGGEEPFYDILEYDPETGSVVKKNSTLPTARYAVSSVYCSSNDKIYIFGGYDGSYLSDILEYDPETDSISKKEEILPTGRMRTSAAYVTNNNKIYIFGGYSGSFNSEIIEYDPETGNVITMEESLPAPRAQASAEYNIFTNKAYIFGGYPRVSDIIEFDPVTGGVKKLDQSLPMAMNCTSVANYSNNKFFIFGGWPVDGPINTIIEFNFNNYPSEGYFLSPAKDCNSTAEWETISWNGSEPAGTDLTFQTRSGNTSVPDETWSSWSDNYTDSDASITSPSARYIQVRANFSTTISSQTPVLNDFTITYDYVDKSSPTVVSTVNDGLEEDSDVTFSTYTLYSNWPVSTDPESGIKGYWYAVGTTEEGTDIQSWTYNGTATTVTVSGLSLNIGTTYYFSVKAENNAGLLSEPVSSDGIRVASSVLDHYEVICPTLAVTGSPFTVTVHAKNNTNDTIESQNNSVILQAVQADNINLAGSGILSVPVLGIYNGEGTTTGESYTKVENIKLKATDSLDYTGLSQTISFISYQEADLTVTANPLSILIGQTSQIQATIEDYYNNPIPGAEVRFSITQGAGTISPATGTTDTDGTITATFTPDIDGAGKVRIYITSGDLEPVYIEIEVSALITTAGGIVIAGTDTKTRLQIPPGILNRETQVTMVSEAVSTNQSVKYDIRAAYDDTGETITDLNSPITLTLHYNIDSNGKIENTNITSTDAGTKLAISYNDGVRWQKIGGTVDTVEQTLTAEITHLSQYAVIAVDTGSGFRMNGIGPNPFTPNPDGMYDRVHFYFDNPENKAVTLKIYDMGGNMVRDVTVTPGVVPYWDGRNNNGGLVEGGVYIYYLTLGGDTAKGTIVLAK